MAEDGRWLHLLSDAQRKAATCDGHLNRRAVAVVCPACDAQPGERCEVDPAARPYPSTMRVGGGDPFHIARSRASALDEKL